jgi:acylphosphatase
MGTSDGTVLGNTKIVDNGPATERWNVVIAPDGYRSSEMAQWATDAQQFANTLLATAPFDRLRTAINIYRVDVTSTDSGAKDPTDCDGTGAKPKTYFDASFCTNGIRRLLVANNGRVLSVVSAQVPQWHMAVLAVNSAVYGGSGGAVATFSKADGALEIALHEMGHTAFSFADEYEYYQGCGSGEGHEHHSGSEPSQPNVTTNANIATTKWRNLIKAATAVPTTKNANCGVCDPQPSPVPSGTVGLFEGADYYHCGCYRPEFNCRMRSLNSPFCAVCQQVIVQKLTPFLPASRSTSLGGAIADLTVASNLDGRLEVFARGTDNTLMHIWQTAPNGSWSAWMSLGGVLTGAPVVARNADGRLEVFARHSDKTLWHIAQTAPNSGWGAWMSLAGKLADIPVVARNADGRLELFARDKDDKLTHIAQTAPNAGWGAWMSLDGSVRELAVINNADGRLEVFARGSDSKLKHIAQTAPNGGWGAWMSLEGKLAGPLAVGRNADGRLEVFVRDKDKTLKHIFQTAPNGAWGAWTSLGSEVNELAAVNNADGRLEVFTRGSDNALWHIWQTAPNNGWSAWSSLRSKLAGGPSVTRNTDGRLEAFIKGTDNALWHLAQTAPNNGWV